MGPEMEEEIWKKKVGRRGWIKRRRRKRERRKEDKITGTEDLGNLGQFPGVYVRNKILPYKTTKTWRFFSKSSIYHN